MWRPSSDRGGGAPPTPPLRSETLTPHGSWTGFPRALRALARREEPAHRADPSSAPPFSMESFWPRAPSPASRSGRPRRTSSSSARSVEPEPGELGAPQADALLRGQLVRRRARLGRPRDADAASARAREDREGGRPGRQPRITSRSGDAPAGRPSSASLDAEIVGIGDGALAILLDMTRAHVPVLAGELIDLLARRRRDRVDCTFGAGGHARLVADRIGPAGTLVCIDRDPAAEERFEAFAAEVACDTRFLRMDFSDGLALLREEGVEADMVYLDLGISSMQVDAWERGFSYSYDAPLDMRMDPARSSTRATSSTAGTSAAWPSSSAVRRGAPPRAGSRARSCGAARAGDRDHPRPGRDDQGRAARARRAVRRRPPGQARVPGDPDRGERRARRARPRAARGLGRPARRRPARRHLVPLARGPARQALPRRAGARLHLPARPADLRLRPRARGRAPHPRARSRPRPGEVADNPRARSGKLRAARKLAAEEAPDGARPAAGPPRPPPRGPPAAARAPHARARRRAPQRPHVGPRRRGAPRPAAVARPRAVPQRRSRARCAPPAALMAPLVAAAAGSRLRRRPARPASSSSTSTCCG